MSEMKSMIDINKVYRECFHLTMVNWQGFKEALTEMVKEIRKRRMQKIEKQKEKRQPK